MDNLNKLDYLSQNGYLIKNKYLNNNTHKTNYLFSLSKKTKTAVIINRGVNNNHGVNNNQEYNKKIIIQKTIEGPAGPSGPEGPTGPSGKDGDRFCTKTISKVCFKPTENSMVATNVETGLSYISGNSVIVAEVPHDINDDLNTFEGIVQYYNPLSGHIIIKDVTNIHGEFGVYACYYHVNLDGVDGAQGEQGPPGPTGPSNISETSISLILLDNTITIPEQTNAITYYTLNVNNNDEIKDIQSNLKTNQIANILIELIDIEYNDNSNATLFTSFNGKININYSKNIILNIDSPFVMLKIYNINNNTFVEFVSYYKNNFISL